MKKWIGLTLGGLAGLLAFRLLEVPIAAGVSKMVASCGFIALAISGGAGSTRYGKIILAGLFFSWWGDAFLIGTNSLYFQLGLVSFLLGHVCYSTAFFVHGVRVRWSLLTLLLLTPFAVGILVWLLPYVPGDLRGPVLAYIVVITSMVVLAVGVRGRGGPLGIAVGAVTILYFGYSSGDQPVCRSGYASLPVGIAHVLCRAAFSGVEREIIGGIFRLRSPNTSQKGVRA